ncbi:hypothetical protein [Algoriphagus resistens]|uniref:hypothetical protein n=1 Tax=Algoriphagus resistens TaxID=1750590 RepID=UPI000B2A5AB1|nr:hypothetical protein [Algoriphagus resistens]
MKEQFRDLNILTGKVAGYLDSQQYFLPPAIEQYQKIWRLIRYFMDSKGYRQYSIM